MKQAIGSATVINIIIIFIVIVFGLLAATFSYAKAYKVNTRIMNGIEIYEGYNDEALSYIDKALSTLGYSSGIKNCDATMRLNGEEGTLVTNTNNNFYYCVYRFPTTVEGSCYYSYGVVTYITFRLPIVGRFDVPVKSKTNRIFDFDEEANANC